MRQSGQRAFIGPVLVFVAYFIAGRLGLAVPYTSGNVSPVWPAAGIAFAGILLFGYRVGWGIALAALAVNFFSPIPHRASFGIALGNTVGPMLGAFLFLRSSDSEIRLQNLRQILRFILFGCLCGTALTACIGVSTLFLTGVNPWSRIPSAWTIWWLGDGTGVLLIAPLVIHARDLWVKKERLAELLLLQASLVVATELLFNTGVLTEQIFSFAILPFIIWSAVRFGMAGAGLSNCVVAAIVIWATAHGLGPFVLYGTHLLNATVLQAFVAVLSISGLMLATLVAERQGVEQALAREENLRRAEAALRRSEKLAAAGRLAATMSHEINNPLEAVKNLLFLLQKEVATAGGKELLGMTQHEVQRVVEICKRTLGFFRESSKPAPVNLAELADEILAVYAKAISQKKIAVVRDYSGQPVATVLRGELQQVFSNLIANAIDAMGEPGRLRISIQDVSRNGSSGLQIVISDNGMGIPQQNLARIFDSFFTTKESSGTGLGLWITREIVEKHGGQISVASEAAEGPQRGTRFTIFLPQGQ